MSFKIEESLFYHIRRTEHALYNHAVKIMKPYDIAPEQFGILKLITEQNRAMNIAELSNVLNRDKSTITRMIKSLEKKEFVFRENCVEDKRVVYINISDSGKALVNEAMKLIIDIKARVENGLNEKDVEVFLKVINTLYENVRKEIEND